MLVFLFNINQYYGKFSSSIKGKLMSFLGNKKLKSYLKNNVSYTWQKEHKIALFIIFE